MQIILNEKKSKKGGFTLIEMIGVLAVIGILAALLVPKIFNAINNARVNSTAVSIATIKTATADHYAKFGSLVSSNGTTETNVTLGRNPFVNFDTALGLPNNSPGQTAVMSQLPIRPPSRQRGVVPIGTLT